jgi:hypothetical protein
MVEGTEPKRIKYTVYANRLVLVQGFYFASKELCRDFERFFKGIFFVACGGSTYFGALSFYEIRHS